MLWREAEAGAVEAEDVVVTEAAPEAVVVGKVFFHLISSSIERIFKTKSCQAVFFFNYTISSSAPRTSLERKILRKTNFSSQK